MEYSRLTNLLMLLLMPEACSVPSHIDIILNLRLRSWLLLPRNAGGGVHVQVEDHLKAPGRLEVGSWSVR